MQKMSRKNSETRNLTDKELTALSRAFGQGVRSQTVAVADIVQTNLKTAFAARREQATRLLKEKKIVAA